MHTSVLWPWTQTKMSSSVLQHSVSPQNAWLTSTEPWRNFLSLCLIGVQSHTISTATQDICQLARRPAWPSLSERSSSRLTSTNHMRFPLGQSCLQKMSTCEAVVFSAAVISLTHWLNGKRQVCNDYYLATLSCPVFQQRRQLWSVSQIARPS